MIEEFSKGSTIIVDKPLHWTSFDVVNKLRWHLKRKLNVKKIKVGHAGTLDPLATGVLVICIGKHTKRIEELMAGTKVYTGKILLGKTTPSYDLETEYDRDDWPIDHIDQALLDKAKGRFIGEIDQTPPIFSAKMVEGKRAYDLARSGKDVKLKSARVTIDSFELNMTNFPVIDFTVECSKGTYIRSLAFDLGVELGSGATLIELRRVRSGDQSLDEARSVDEWIEFIQNTPL